MSEHDKGEGPKVSGATLEQQMLDALQGLVTVCELTFPEGTPFPKHMEHARKALERAWKEHAKGALDELKQPPTRG